MILIVFVFAIQNLMQRIWKECRIEEPTGFICIALEREIDVKRKPL